LKPSNLCIAEKRTTFTGRALSLTRDGWNDHLKEKITREKNKKTKRERGKRGGKNARKVRLKKRDSHGGGGGGAEEKDLRGQQGPAGQVAGSENQKKQDVRSPAIKRDTGGKQRDGNVKGQKN